MSQKTLRLFAFFILFLCSVSQAAQVGQVIVDAAPVREFPQASAHVFSSIPSGENVVVSNIPTEGFYKVRLKSGELGWVSGNDILVGKTTSGVTPVKDEDEEHPQPHPEKTRTEREKPEKERPNDQARLIFMGGLQYPAYTNLKDYYVTEGLSPGIGFGAEMQFQVIGTLFWAARAEYLKSSAGPLDLGNGTTQTIKAKAIPIMVGLHWSILNGPFRVGIGAYGGMALSSGVTVTQSTSLTTNEINYSSTDLTTLLSMQMSIPIGNKIGLFGEAAYRTQKSGNFGATATVPAFAIDYSGPVFRGGFELRF